MNIGEITHEDNGRVSGYVAEAGFDFTIFFQTVASDNPDAPVFNIMTKSPRGRDVRVGSIWERGAKETGEIYFGGYLDTAQSGLVPIRIFRSKRDQDVWNVVRQTARRRRQEAETISLPEAMSSDDCAPQHQRTVATDERLAA